MKFLLIASLAFEVDFQVRFLGFGSYHAHHHADEQWTGECDSMVSNDEHRLAYRLP
jgi:hypothetical protein